MEVLLVEDNKADQRIFAEAFHACCSDAKLNVVSSGDEALQFLKKRLNPPELILLDLNLPGKSGHETLTEIKADERLRQIPVAILTSSDSPQDVSACYREHANCYLVKPTFYDELAQLMRLIYEFWLVKVKTAPDVACCWRAAA
jgi:two-component system, chemotaxis family, response regulator Rcp1